MQNSLVLHLPQRRQRRPEHDRAARGRAVRRLHGQRARTSRASRARRPATQVGTTVIPGTGGALGVRQRPASPAPATTATRKGFDTLFGDGSGGAGSDLARLPGRRLHARPTARTSTAATTGSPARCRRCRPAGSAAGSTAYGSPTNPLQAVSLDSSLSKQIRSSKAPGLRARGPRRRALHGARRRRGDVRRDRARSAGWRGVRRRGNDGARPRARRSTASRSTCRTASARLQAPAAGAGYPANSDLSRACSSRRRCSSAGLGTRVITIDWGSFDTHGDQLSSQDPQLSTLSRALAAFKADLAARGIERQGRDDGVLRVRPPRRVQRLARHRPRRRRHDDAVGLGGARRPARRAPGRDQTDDDGDLRRDDRLPRRSTSRSSPSGSAATPPRSCPAARSRGCTATTAAPR